MYFNFDQNQTHTFCLGARHVCNMQLYLACFETKNTKLMHIMARIGFKLDVKSWAIDSFYAGKAENTAYRIYNLIKINWKYANTLMILRVA